MIRAAEPVAPAIPRPRARTRGHLLGLSSFSAFLRMQGNCLQLPYIKILEGPGHLPWM